MRNKILALFLTMVLTLSMASVAFAATDTGTYTFTVTAALSLDAPDVGFGTVPASSAKTITGATLVTTAGPNISELKVSAGAISAASGTAWAWAATAADKVNLAITITAGPTGPTYPLAAQTIIAATTYTFFTGLNLAAGAYTATLVLTVGTASDATLGVVNTTVLTFTATAA
ncbi:MAG: hypothetical protein Q8P22_08425 [Chloroflexota bacterium]|nr:hypothetical protein [Chloroflexota bacterium]